MCPPFHLQYCNFHRVLAHGAFVHMVMVQWCRCGRYLCMYMHIYPEAPITCTTCMGPPLTYLPCVLTCENDTMPPAGLSNSVALLDPLRSVQFSSVQLSEAATSCTLKEGARGSSFDPPSLCIRCLPCPGANVYTPPSDLLDPPDP